MPVGLSQVFAIQGAIHAHFALGSAAEGANIAPHTGAKAPRTPGLANGANHFLSIKVKGAKAPMSRTNLFFKVEVEHDSDENPERMGAEIERHLKKLYGVIDVELSSITREEE
jgi:hypothetical protein